jgi:cell division protease FtsH
MLFPKNNDKDKKPDGSPPKNQPPQFRVPPWVWPAFWIIILLWFFWRVPEMVDNAVNNPPIDVPYSLFYDQVTAGNVQEVTIEAQDVTGVFIKDVEWPKGSGNVSNRFHSTLLPVDDPQLPDALRENNVTVVSQVSQPSPILLFLLNFGPILLLVGFFIWQARRAQRQAGGIFGFGRSQAREYNSERPQVTFSDVAGQEAAKTELVEIVDFLKEPDKYIALGARIPRGVLLVGPPGTGKTLMARAVAGEAKVAFFSLSASEFVEMFVGVGASRVRDLFSRAKAASPSIVFIDEIDAVGRQRGAGLGGGNDEREQTLNQLLSEMDGFDQDATVIVMAATNRPDVLDPALLRPGRFDRQVTVGLPDRNGRLDILKIHTRGKPLAEDVNLEDLAKATIGFSGADISNLANEAALAAARRSRKRITARDFSDAFDRIVLGTESPPLTSEHERRVVAYHEAGHALVAALTPGADPVLKVTIIPRGQALGITAQLPVDDRRNYSREYIMTRMLVLLGGRSAEEVAIGEITTGAENDLRQVTSLARRMVAQFGMSDAIGPLNFGDDERQPFLGYSLAQGRNYSDETAARIDAEVKRIVEEAHRQARMLLETNRDKLETLATELLIHEIVDQHRVLEIANVQPQDITELNPEM